MSIITPEIEALGTEATGWRRHLHQNPEIGYDLPNTSAFVAGKLKEFGIDEVITGIGQTGVVGVLRGQSNSGNASDAIMIRADMDALPMEEETGLPHASQIKGRFHGCGHDGHTSCLLATAKLLAGARDFEGTVYFCFQPAEEGGAGAKAMVDDGLFERFPVKAIYGAHNFPGLPIGMMGCTAGPMLAASQEFEIIITGKGGHAARPHQASDSIVAGSDLVIALQTIVSRVLDPVDTAVLSVTQFHGGTTDNVIPGKVRLNGTMRSFSDKVMRKMISEMKLKTRFVCRAHGVSGEVKLMPSPYPALVNSRLEAKFASDVMVDLLGEKACLINPPPAMGSEDFAYYLIRDPKTKKKTPGCFVTFGNGRTSAGLHNPAYDFNDEAIPYMVAFWSNLVSKALPRSGATC